MISSNKANDDIKYIAASSSTMHRVGVYMHFAKGRWSYYAPARLGCDFDLLRRRLSVLIDAGYGAVQLEPMYVFHKSSPLGYHSMGSAWLQRFLAARL